MADTARGDAAPDGWTKLDSGSGPVYRFNLNGDPFASIYRSALTGRWCGWVRMQGLGDFECSTEEGARKIVQDTVSAERKSIPEMTPTEVLAAAVLAASSGKPYSYGAEWLREEPFLCGVEINGREELLTFAANLARTIIEATR